jgi:hypothetical protein
MKGIVTFLLSFLISWGSYGQLVTIGKKEFGYFYFGPKVGLTLSKISNTSNSLGGSSVFRTGFELGVSGKLGINEKWALQPELMFVKKGVTVESGIFESNYKTSYIGIPILVQYSLMSIGVTRIHLEGGGVVNVRTSGTAELNSAAVGQSYEVNLDNSSWRSMDYGVVIGAGAEWPRKLGIWVFELHYDYGFMDVYKDDSEFNANRTVGFSLIYLYDFIDFYKRLSGNLKSKGGKIAP